MDRTRERTTIDDEEVKKVARTERRVERKKKMRLTWYGAAVK